jgi:hypothetical protein
MVTLAFATVRLFVAVFPLIFLACKTTPKFDQDQTFTAAVCGGVDWTTLRNGGDEWVGGYVGPSARTIIELNIKHYRALLKTETDASKRQTIAKLLAEEEAQLAKLSEQERKDE